MLRNTLKYLTLFVWGVLFLYYFNKLMPKTILYPIIGIPLLIASSLTILKMFGHKERTDK